MLDATKYSVHGKGFLAFPDETRMKCECDLDFHEIADLEFVRSTRLYEYFPTHGEFPLHLYSCNLINSPFAFVLSNRLFIVFHFVVAYVYDWNFGVDRSSLEYLQRIYFVSERVQHLVRDLSLVRKEPIGC